jgi:hypothetical protein
MNSSVAYLYHVYEAKRLCVIFIFIFLSSNIQVDG